MWYICELEKHHGVDIGTNYLNESAGRTFIHYIAEAKRQQVVQAVHSAKFFSLLLDGSTDKDNIDNELVLVIWCDTDGNDEKTHTRISYLSVVRPQTTNTQGLFDVVEASLQKLGVQSIDSVSCKKLVGMGTDGASVKIAAVGLKCCLKSK